MVYLPRYPCQRVCVAMMIAAAAPVLVLVRTYMGRGAGRVRVGVYDASCSRACVGAHMRRVGVGVYPIFCSSVPS